MSGQMECCFTPDFIKENPERTGNIFILIKESRHLVFQMPVSEVQQAESVHAQGLRQQFFRENGDAQTGFRGPEQRGGIDALPGGNRFQIGERQNVIQRIAYGAAALSEEQRISAQLAKGDYLPGRREIGSAGGAQRIMTQRDDLKVSFRRRTFDERDVGFSPLKNIDGIVRSGDTDESFQFRSRRAETAQGAA